MKEEGYIPISRRLFEHQFWCEERTYSRFEAWLDVVRSARFEDTKQLIGNRFIEVKRGQMLVSLRFFGSRWQWSTKKVSSFLDLLIQDKMITKETPKETGQTVITICNYDKYNRTFNEEETQKKQQGNSKETPWKQQGNKINKENKDNNIILPLRACTCEEVFPSDVYDKPLIECYDLLVADQAWYEPLCMNNHLTIGGFRSYLQAFFKKLQNEGEKTKSVKDGKSHFARWVQIELQNKTKNGTNKQNAFDSDSERKEQIARRAADAIARSGR